ncbi:MAG: rhodanese-like domain-containing protein, partial [Acidobacteriota bacterium]
VVSRDRKASWCAQSCGGRGVDKRIDIIATAIMGGMGVQDLEQLDLCYAPPFGSAKDVIVQAGFAANNSRKGGMPEMTAGEFLKMLESEEPLVVIDVRSPKEYNRGHVPNAVLLPLSHIRARKNEVPSTGNVALYCRSGYRSYVAQRILMNSGWENVYNAQGGYQMIQLFSGLPPEGIPEQYTCLTAAQVAGNFSSEPVIQE